MKNYFTNQCFFYKKGFIFLFFAHLLIVGNLFATGGTAYKEEDENNKKLLPPPTPTVTLALPPTANTCFSVLTASGCVSPNTVRWYRDGTILYSNVNPLTVSSSEPVFLRAACFDGSTIGGYSAEFKAVSAIYTQITPSNPAPICSNGSVLFNASSASSGLTYQWRRNNSNITGATSSSYTATLNGSYSVVASNGSCSGTSIQTGFLNVVTAPTLNITSSVTSPATITNGQSLTLTRQGCSGTVVWSNSATTPSITVSPSSNTTYSFTCTQSPCVVTSGGFIVNVNPLLPPTLSSSSPSTCTGSSVTLTATACADGGIVTWSTTQTGLSISVSPSVTSNYTATCTVGSVTSANSSPITIAVFDGIITSLASSDWNTPATWSCNCIPATCNNVIVDTGHVVTIPATQKGRLQNLTLRGIVDVKTTGTMALK